MKKTILTINVSTSWNIFLDNEKKKEYFIKLANDLERLYKSKNIYPSIEKIFHALSFFDFEKTKVLILGQDPYHIDGMAHGLAFSTTLNIVPKSLQNIFKEIYNSTGVVRKNPNLTDWAEQGVLLLNSILTVEAHKPLSHKNIGWEIFTKNLIEFLDSTNKNIIYLLMGNKSIYYSQFIKNSKFIFETSHPSPFSCYVNFYGSNVFEKINDVLRTINTTPIKW
ncbi:MAG: uracil-DNA glycosylase [Malacoplasma sp.]